MSLLNLLFLFRPYVPKRCLVCDRDVSKDRFQIPFGNKFICNERYCLETWRLMNEAGAKAMQKVKKARLKSKVGK